MNWQTLAGILIAGSLLWCTTFLDAEAHRGRRDRVGVSGAEIIPDAGPTSDAGVMNDASIQITGTAANFAVPDNVALTTETAQTVAFWFQKTTEASVAFICGKSGASTSKEWAIQNDSSDLTEIRFIWGTSVSHSGRTTGTTLNTGTWYHVCVRYDGTQATNATRLRAWINGSEVTLTYAGTVPAALTDTATDLTCGRTHNLAQQWAGYVDEFVMWESLQDCPTIYNSGTHLDFYSFATAPLVWYRADDSTGTTIINTITPGTHNGSLVGTAAIVLVAPP